MGDGVNGLPNAPGASHAGEASPSGQVLEVIMVLCSCHTCLISYSYDKLDDRVVYNPIYNQAYHTTHMIIE
uniref:Uncharacterized protein n=1 Tax=Sphaerodactylus townsendi TaxID=933632 RepID=A0ACB8FW62_9SAUR